MAEPCWYCAGDGKDERDGHPDGCPECGKKRGEIKYSIIEEKSVAAVLDKADKLFVPTDYLGRFWNEKQFWDYPGRKRNGLLDHYVSQLGKLVDMFKDGLIPSSSAFIMSPSTYSKDIFMYTCIQYALVHDKFTIAPVLDTMQLKRLLILGGERPNYKMFGWLDYDEYLSSDILFVKVTKTAYRNDAGTVLKSLLDIRSRLGLPTFIVSSVNIATMSKWDKEGGFAPLRNNYNQHFNFKKYPKIIEYFPTTR